MLPLSAPPGELYWRETVPEYPNHKMLLRTIGGVAIVGKWEGDLGQYFVAWCPLPRNSKEKSTLPD